MIHTYNLFCQIECNHFVKLRIFTEIPAKVCRIAAVVVFSGKGNVEEVVEGRSVPQGQREEGGVGPKGRARRTPHAAAVRRRPLAAEQPRRHRIGTGAVF